MHCKYFMARARITPYVLNCLQNSDDDKLLHPRRSTTNASIGDEDESPARYRSSRLCANSPAAELPHRHPIALVQV